MPLLRRSVAAILIATLMPQLTGCTLHATRRVPLAQLHPEELGRAPEPPERRFAGVTAGGGMVLMFDTVPEQVTHDTVYG